MESWYVPRCSYVLGWLMCTVPPALPLLGDLCQQLLDHRFPMLDVPRFYRHVLEPRKPR